MKIYDKIKSIAKKIKKESDFLDRKRKFKDRKRKFKDKTVLKERKKVTIRLNQPVYEEDRPRYYKAAWEEERRELFFK